MLWAMGMVLRFITVQSHAVSSDGGGRRWLRTNGQAQGGRGGSDTVVSPPLTCHGQTPAQSETTVKNQWNPPARVDCKRPTAQDRCTLRHLANPDPTLIAGLTHKALIAPGSLPGPITPKVVQRHRARTDPTQRPCTPCHSGYLGNSPQQTNPSSPTTSWGLLFIPLTVPTSTLSTGSSQRSRHT